MRNRKLQTPKGRETRPTGARVREAIFNALAHRGILAEARVWDLFAGSGALGIEALSRGAESVVFVESHARTAALIKANLSGLAIPPGKAQVVCQPVLRWLERIVMDETVNLVLMDPPYGGNDAAAVLSFLARHPLLAPGAVITVEQAAGTPLPMPAGIELFQTKAYGDTQVCYCHKSC